MTTRLEEFREFIRTAPRTQTGTMEVTTIKSSQVDADFFTSLRLKMSKERLDTPMAQHSVIYACVDAICKNLARLPFKIQSAHSEGEVEVANELLTLFEDPNPLMSKADLMYFVGMWLMLSGETIIVKEGYDRRVQNVTEVPAELWPLNGALFTHVVDPKTKLVSHWVLNKGSKDEVVYFPHEVIHIRLPNPYNPYRGLAPLSAAMAAARVDWAATKFNEAYFNNGADPGGIITYPEKVRLTPTQRGEVIDAWDDSHSGPDKNMRTAVLDRGASYESFAATHRDMQWLEGKTWHRDEILMVFGVPQSVAGIPSANYATADVESKSFWTKTVAPHAERIDTALWSFLFQYVLGGRFMGSLDMSEVPELQDDINALMVTAAAMQAMGWTASQINDRLKLGMPTNDWQKTAWGTFGQVPMQQLLDDPDFGLPGAATEAPTPEPLQEPTEPLPEQPAEEQVQDLALNGAQIASLLEVVVQVASGLLHPDAAIAVLGAAFPSLSDQQIADIIDPVREAYAASVAEAPEPEPEAPEPEAPVEAAITDEEEERRAALWNDYEKTFFAPEERRYLGMMRRHVLKLRAESLRLLASNEKTVTKTTVEDVLFDVKKWRDRLVKSSRPHYERITTRAALRLAASVGSSTQWSADDPIIQALTESLASRVVGVNDTIRKKLRKTLEEGLEANETLGQLQERVKATFKTTMNRAITIARTETGSASNRARFVAMDREGEVEQHQWISSRDVHVRDSHKRGTGVDGETRNLGEEFSNGLRFPHDPEGEGADVINCRCLTVPVVEAP